jgi:hypothetical protein
MYARATLLHTHVGSVRCGRAMGCGWIGRYGMARGLHPDGRPLLLPPLPRTSLAQDTAGQERFHALGPIYYRDADGAQQPPPPSPCPPPVQLSSLRTGRVVRGDRGVHLLLMHIRQSVPRFALICLTYGLPLTLRSAAALLVYDVTDVDSFARVQNWVKELRKIVGEDIALCIAGNKVRAMVMTRSAQERRGCSRCGCLPQAMACSSTQTRAHGG